MQSNTSGQNIKDTLQRLVDGLQRTLQVFRVLSEQDIERGNVLEEPCGPIPGSSHQYPIYKKKHGLNRKYSRLDRRKFDEEELNSYDYEMETLKVLPAEVFTSRNFKDISSGAFNNNKSNVKTKTKVTRKHPKKITFYIDDGEVSDTLSVTPGKGGDADLSFFPPFFGEGLIFPPYPAEKRKEREEEEPQDAMKPCTCPKQQKKGSDSSIEEKQPKRRKNADLHEYKKPSPVEDVRQREKEGKKGVDKQQPTGSRKKNENEKTKGCCGRCCKRFLRCFRGKKKPIARRKGPLNEERTKSPGSKHRERTKEPQRQKLHQYKSKSLLELESDSKRASKQTKTLEPQNKPIELKEPASTSKIQKGRKDDSKQQPSKSNQDQHKKRAAKHKSKSLENLQTENRSKSPHWKKGFRPSEAQKEKYNENQNQFEENKKKHLKECCKPTKEQPKKDDESKPGTSKMDHELQGKKLEKHKNIEKKRSKKTKKPKISKKSSRERSGRPQSRKEKYREWLDWFLERRKIKREERRRKKLGESCTPSKVEAFGDVDSTKARPKRASSIGDLQKRRKRPQKGQQPNETDSKIIPLRGRILSVEDLNPARKSLTDSKKGSSREPPKPEYSQTRPKSPPKDIETKRIPLKARIFEDLNKKSPSDYKKGRSREDSKPKHSDTGFKIPRKGQPPKDIATNTIPQKRSPLDIERAKSPTDSKRGRTELEHFDPGLKSPRKAQPPKDIATNTIPQKRSPLDIERAKSPTDSKRGISELEDSDAGLKSPRKGQLPKDIAKKTIPHKGRLLTIEDVDPDKISKVIRQSEDNKPICSKCLEECKILTVGPRKVCTDRETLKKVDDWNEGRKSVGEERSCGDSSHVESYKSLGPAETVSAEAAYQKKQKILDLENSGRPVNADFVLIFLLNFEEQFGDILERFLQRIQDEGMLLECVFSIDYLDTVFIKVQIPPEVAKNLAKVYDVKLACTNPYFEYEREARYICKNTELTSISSTSSVVNRNRIAVKGEKPKEPISSERTRVLYELLKITKFSDELDDYGIWEMKRKGVIADAYVLHDGPSEWNKTGPLNERQLLRRYWAAIRKMFSIQPIQHVGRYFGPEVAYYFAFMDFYITMLIPVAIAGVITVLYGWATMHNNTLVNLYCDNKNYRNKIVCPICESPNICGFSLFDSCTNFKLTYLFDNTCTMWFGIFTSIWGIVFTGLWIRQQNSLKVSWNLHERIEMDLFPRPPYFKRARTLNISRITGEPELQVSKLKEFFSKMFVAEGMLVAILMVLLILFLLILYRIQLTADLAASDKTKNSDGIEVQRRSPAIRTVALRTSILSSVIIVVFSHLFDFVAVFLTKVENPRTQGEYDRSHILKLVLFSCVNHYHMVIYLAFFRSMMYTHPGDAKMWKKYYGINADICDTSGCLIDVVYYITTLLIVKTIANCLQQLLIPTLFNTKPNGKNRPQWELDYHLLPTSPYYFSKLNIESITQYGFVIFFMPAFPLLPLVALIVNLIDTKVNAKGLIQLRRRPIPRQICERELWNHILYTMTFIGIIIHGFVAAFVLNYVERRTFEGTKIFPPSVTYLDAAFTSFTVDGYARYKKAKTAEIKECIFFAKRQLIEQGAYETTPYYFQVLGSRLSTVAILLGLVITGGVIFLSTMPTVPYRTQEKINYLENEEIF